MEMEYFSIVGGFLLIAMLIFFRYALLYCCRDYPPAPMMRSAALAGHPGMSMLTRTRIPYSVSGLVTEYNQRVMNANEAGLFGHVYTIPTSTGVSTDVPRSVLQQPGLSIGGATALQPRPDDYSTHVFRSHERFNQGPPDYETVMSGTKLTVTPRQRRNDGEMEVEHSNTPPPTYDMVIDRQMATFNRIEGMDDPRARTNTMHVRHS